MALRNKARGFLYITMLIMFTTVLLCTGCRNGRTKEVQEAPIVAVADIIVKDVPVYSEWTASADGLVNAVIRAQVQGYLVGQTYKEGDFVQKGQVLFTIDPRTFQAALERAKGQLGQQMARWDTAKANLERIKPLVQRRAISLKDLDDAVGAEAAARAAVAEAQAVVDKAEVDLGFTKITSPIAGVAGIAKAQIGNLVGTGSIEELTTVSTVDPIKVYVAMSEPEYLQYIQNSGGNGQKLSLQMVFADGRIHPHKGKFAFADRQVDVKTGTIKVAALFPNPGNVVRPGQFARVIAETTTKKGAILVPQRAVSELQGGYQVAVVGPDNKVNIRSVTVAERVDDLWVVDKGLKPGDRVIAEGIQKVREGTFVTIKPFRGASSTSPGGKKPGSPSQDANRTTEKG